MRLALCTVLTAALAILRSACYTQNKPMCNCVCGAKGRFNRIVGGQDTHPHDHPWATALFKNNVLYCGATIVSFNYLITAAHCVYSFAPKEISVYVGAHNLAESANYETKLVSALIYHQHFDAVTFNNDIGLIKVDSSLSFGPKVQPVCLPSLHETTEYSGELGLVSGWGHTGENAKPSSTLKRIVVPIWSQEKCLQSGYGSKRLTSNMMCAGYEEGLFDACQGDSGGSMLRELSSGSIEVIGIISWGRGCARPNFPGIYTVVGNYKDWIAKHLGSECLCIRKQ